MEVLGRPERQIDPKVKVTPQLANLDFGSTLTVSNMDSQ